MLVQQDVDERLLITSPNRETIQYTQNPQASRYAESVQNYFKCDPLSRVSQGLLPANLSRWIGASSRLKINQFSLTPLSPSKKTSLSLNFQQQVVVHIHDLQ
ncbi:MAG: hypothetical protein EZS28_000114 [Streblomastix strix]|uniref:Uncharacterized protein n=1 Tax=Streblomastix strix TaxID=222440 RepID=A0A5J4XAM4_9EUKA|nr:MAG: hypothetical protein EZS28_000114 [Streblomastix strix]